MEEPKTSTFSHGLLWFGAGVSIAEILTGTLFAPLGFQKGLLAILVGHVIGCALLFLAGVMGGLSGKSAMETVKMSFGQKGSWLFSGLNVLQLLGWTAVMIYSGAVAARSILPSGGLLLWSLLIGGLILIWVLVGVTNLRKINLIAMTALFLLTLVLSFVVFQPGSVAVENPGLPFGAAVELSVAMPLSWLPLISDYTRKAKKPLAASAASAVTYFFTSCWMYLIGLGAALFTGESDIAVIMTKAGLGTIALLIIVFSTVTTTFLDVYSAGVSAESISSKLKEKPVALLVCILGTILAVGVPITQFEGFLYLISSVFAPMIAIQLVDFFLLKSDHSKRAFQPINIGVWLLGFLLYRFLLSQNTPIGITVPVMLLTATLHWLITILLGGRKHV